MEKSEPEAGLFSDFFSLSDRHNCTSRGSKSVPPEKPEKYIFVFLSIGTALPLA
jgi:hypothetical protein